MERYSETSSTNTSGTYPSQSTSEKNKTTSQFNNKSVSTTPGATIVARDYGMPEIREKPLSDRTVRNIRATRLAMKIAAIFARVSKRVRSFLENRTHALAHTLISKNNKASVDEARKLVDSLLGYRNHLGQESINWLCTAYAKLCESYMQFGQDNAVTETLAALHNLAKNNTTENLQLYSTCSESVEQWRKRKPPAENRKPPETGLLVDLDTNEGPLPSPTAGTPTAITEKPQATVDLSPLTEALKSLEDNQVVTLKAENAINPQTTVIYGSKPDDPGILSVTTIFPPNQISDDVSTSEALNLLNARSGENSVRLNPQTMTTEGRLQADSTEHILFRIPANEQHLQERLLAFTTVLHSQSEQKIRDWQKVRFVIDEGEDLIDQSDMESLRAKIIDDTNGFLKPLGIVMDASRFKMIGGATEPVINANRESFAQWLPVGQP